MPFRAIRHLAASIFLVPLLFAPVLAQDSQEALPHRHLTATASDLIKRLQSGGYVLVMRHERTNAFTLDSPKVELENCATQRNLSVAGYANAVENGAILRHLQVPIGQVLASPACRTLETARLLFGKVHTEANLGVWATARRCENSVHSVGARGRGAFRKHSIGDTSRNLQGNIRRTPR